MCKKRRIVDIRAEIIRKGGHRRTGFDHGRRGLYNKRDYIVSNAKLEAKGWRPRHGLDAGIRELIKGYQMLHNEIYPNA